MAARRTASTAQRSGRRAWKWRHARPRAKMMMVGGTTVAAVAATAAAITLANRNEDSSAQRPPATTTTTVAVAVVATAADPVVVTVPATAAPATTEAPVSTVAPTTTAAPETTVEATTTLPAVVSGAGVYTVTISDIVFSGSLFSALPAGPPQQITLVGACDGVGDCTMTDESGEAASTGASPFGGVAGAPLLLVPAGGGTYTSTLEVPLEVCGSGIGNFVATVSGGVLSGSYDFTTNGNCGFASLSMTFSGTRTG